MKVLMACSNTASNIGNDFFYRGVKFALTKLIENIEIFDGYFQPFNAYHLNEKEAISNYDYFSCISGVDAIVISGPVLDKDFAAHFEKVLKNAKQNSKKIFLLSVGGRQYDELEVNHCQETLKKYTPDIIITRDSDTYKHYGNLAKSSYDGICFAFFANDYYTGYETSELGKYITSCFDFAKEPDLLEYRDALHEKDTKFMAKSIHGTKSTVNRIKYALQRNLPAKAGEYNIIRTCHRPIRNKKLIFNRNQIVSSYVSDPYLNLYKNTALTVTDRLHAAVVTLAFGNKACLILDSNRTKLLERAGISACINKIYSSDMKKIKEEKESQLDFLSGAILK